MKRFMILGGFLAGAALLTPAVRAEDHRNDSHHDKRYYDKSGKDYHEFNNNEDRAYRMYLREQHRDYRDFSRENRHQQAQYFTWRHEHPDQSLFKIVIK
ncbi:MAG: hypothetical protein ABI165_21190 [Bryobacteraceae bacterium]